MVTFVEVFMRRPAARRFAVLPKVSTGRRNPVRLAERRHSMVETLMASEPGAAPDTASGCRLLART